MLDSTILGFIGSLVAAIFFGLYPIPRRYVDFGINDFMISMTIGVVITGTIINLFLGIFIPALSFMQWFKGILAGFFWCIGTICYVYSVDCIGVGRATPIKNLTAILGLLFGLIFFLEYKFFTLFNFVFLILGTILLIYSGKILGSIQGGVEITRPSCPINLIIPSFFKQSRKTAYTAGWILALAAAFLYALFTVPIRILSTSTESVFHFLPAVGVGALLTAVLSDILFTNKHNWLKIELKGHFIAALGGVLWTIAFIGLAIGIKYLGLAISNPLANTSTVVSVLYAVFIAKEIEFNYHQKEIIYGLLIAVIGIGFLSLSF